MTALRGLSFRRPAVLGALGALVLIGVWFQLVWKPQGAAIAAAHVRQQSATADLFSAEQRVGHLKHLALEAPQLASLESRLSQALPAQDQLDSLLDQLNAAAQSSGVTLASISVAPPTTGPHPGVVSVAGTTPLALQLSGAGGYFAVQQFLANLRSSARLIIIDSVGLSGAATAPAAGGQGTPLAFAISAHALVGSTAVRPVAPVAAPPATPRPGTGVLETPINAARSTANAASAAAQAQSGGTP